MREQTTTLPPACSAVSATGRAGPARSPTRAKHRDFPPIPRGHYAVLETSALPTQGVRSVRIFGEERVVFRGASGQVFMVDAHCAHLGAHLGEGGKVVGDAIECPFHRWRYSGASGECTHIPYAVRVPKLARVGTHPLLERDGLIFAPYGAGSERDLPLLRWDGHDDPDVRLLVSRSFELRSHPQEFVENAIDTAHFPPIHNTVQPTPEVVFDGDILRVRLEARPLRFPSLIAVPLSITAYGLSHLVVETRPPGLPPLIILQYVTPIEDDRVLVRHRLAARVGRGLSALPRWLVARAMAAFSHLETDPDLRVWHHKVYRPRPVLCEGDGPIGPFRTWARRFYA
jgi:3-ketosteroid 9alpha-monooxygenase subunit A